MTGYPSKKAAANAKLDDDDIQVYQRQWVDLTDEEAQLIYDMGRTPTGMMEMVAAKPKEKNNG